MKIYMTFSPLIVLTHAYTRIYLYKYVRIIWNSTMIFDKFHFLIGCVYQQKKKIIQVLLLFSWDDSCENFTFYWCSPNSVFGCIFSFAIGFCRTKFDHNKTIPSIRDLMLLIDCLCLSKPFDVCVCVGLLTFDIIHSQFYWL